MRFLRLPLPCLPWPCLASPRLASPRLVLSCRQPDSSLPHFKSTPFPHNHSHIHIHTQRSDTLTPHIHHYRSLLNTLRVSFRPEFNSSFSSGTPRHLPRLRHTTSSLNLLLRLLLIASSTNSLHSTSTPNHILFFKFYRYHGSQAHQQGTCRPRPVRIPSTRFPISLPWQLSVPVDVDNYSLLELTILLATLHLHAPLDHRVMTW